jgi:glycosyltransferase involved in cell wall biosynthesis
MNVALLHYSAPPVVGGVESVLAQHARLMAEDGHNVRILAGRGTQTEPNVSFSHIPLANSLHPEILKVKAELDVGLVSKKFDDLVATLTSALGTVLADADILIAHNVCSLNKNLPLTAALKRNWEHSLPPRLILWHHDLAWTTPRYRAELHDGYPWDLLRSNWPGAIQVVVSELRRQELSNLFNTPQDHIVVIPNGIDTKRFLKLDSKTIQFVQQLELLAAEPLLLLPVRITPRKNIELALYSLAALRKKFPLAALVVTGPLGPHNPANVSYFKRLLDLRAELGLEGVAHFLAEHTSEYLPDEVIYDFYHLADALFLPSREEGFGLPLLEAGVSRLPVFCTEIPPLQALSGKYAKYFSPDANPEEVASLIFNHLSADPSFGLSVRVRKGYAWERIYTEKITPLLEFRRDAG